MEPTKDYGWRFLAVGEEIKQGDQYWSGNCWIERSCYGVKQGDYGDGWNGWFATRRRIDPGEGWEIIPVGEVLNGELETTNDGTNWRQETYYTRMCKAGDESDVALGFVAHRRRIQPKSEWIDIKVCKPEIGKPAWVFCPEFGVCLTPKYTIGFDGLETHWHPVKPSEIPQPPVVKKTQEELDKEASAKWYRSDSDNEDTLCEQALRQAFEAGLRAGRAK